LPLYQCHQSVNSICGRPWIWNKYRENMNIASS
jgi:hypothetical protein